MIANEFEYERARDELDALEQRLQRLLLEFPAPAKVQTKAGIRKLIATRQEELAIYEGSLEIATDS